MKHYILILNYNNYSETITYISEIHDNNKVTNIVVVDNGSEKKNFIKLEERLTKYNKVIVIKSKVNLGFAKGNNLGFKYIKDNYSPDYFVHCSNSDIRITQKDFYEKTEQLYKNNNYSILGPNVVTNNEKTSPLGKISFDNYADFLNDFDVKKRYRIEKIYALLRAVHLYKPLIKVARKMKGSNVSSNEGVEILHGCYLIYSPIYNNKFNKCFYDLTFLYGEEQCLFYAMRRLGQKVIYSEKIVVDHFGGASTTFGLKIRLDKIKCSFQIASDLTKKTDEEIKNLWS